MKWKHNLNKIPPNIWQIVRALRTDECEAACVKTIRESDLREGAFSHVKIFLGDVLHFESLVLPAPTTGRYSSYNVHGYDVVYRKEPKVEKSWSIDAPNFGDWSKGSHDIVFDREVYRRAHFPPLFLPLHIECLGHDVLKSSYSFKFGVGRVLNRRSPRFADDLLFDLNLLQENVGNHGVYPSGTSNEDFLKALYVNWEILPPGERDDNITRLLTGVSDRDPKVRAQLVDRYDFLCRLKPTNFIKGVSGFARYFGAQFADNLVVFENIEYGNAAYVMFEEWNSLSHRSRTELLASPGESFIRIRHTRTWKVRLKRVIAEHRRTGR